jgi:hypothetical protein
VLIAEALRINQRWIDEVVEAFSICPFAVGARRAHAVARHVLVAPTPDAAAEAAREKIAELASQRSVDVALLIFPSLTLDLAAFDRFCQPLRQADRELVGAVFHPHTPYSLESPAQAVGFFRRTPDPTLQLLRAEALEAVRNAVPGGKFLFDWSAAAWAELLRRQEKQPVTDKIASDNFQLLVGGQLARLQAILDDIAADRARSYGG